MSRGLMSSVRIDWWHQGVCRSAFLGMGTEEEEELLEGTSRKEEKQPNEGRPRDRKWKERRKVN